MTMNGRLQIRESDACRQCAACRGRGFLPVLCFVFCVLYTGLLAQNYRCDWSVVGQGGGDMSSTSFRAGTTVGQTAIGQIAGTTYQAFIGFWQIDTAASGIQEQKSGPQVTPLTTMLYAPAPNPCVGPATIRYSLASTARVSVRLFDLTGRNIAVLVNAEQQAGRYSVPLIPQSALRMPHFSSGIYFVKMQAGDYHGTQKLIIQ
jgi:hypothetical protein